MGSGGNAQREMERKGETVLCRHTFGSIHPVCLKMPLDRLHLSRTRSLVRATDKGVRAPTSIVHEHMGPVGTAGIRPALARALASEHERVSNDLISSRSLGVCWRFRFRQRPHHRWREQRVRHWRCARDQRNGEDADVERGNHKARVTRTKWRDHRNNPLFQR